MKNFIRAAGVFSFVIPEWLEDDAVVGKVVGVAIHAGEVRRLTAALTEIDKPSPDDEVILDFLRKNEFISAIKHYRLVTNEGLKQSKEYVEDLGLKYGLRFGRHQ